MCKALQNLLPFRNCIIGNIGRPSWLLLCRSIVKEESTNECTCGTIFICILHIHIAAVSTIITHDLYLLPSGFVAQSDDQIRWSWVRYPPRSDVFFPLRRAISLISLPGLTVSGKFIGSLKIKHFNIHCRVNYLIHHYCQGKFLSPEACVADGIVRGRECEVLVTEPLSPFPHSPCGFFSRKRNIPKATQAMTAIS